MAMDKHGTTIQAGDVLAYDGGNTFFLQLFLVYEHKGNLYWDPRVVSYDDPLWQVYGHRERHAESPPSFLPGGRQDDRTIVGNSEDLLTAEGAMKVWPHHDGTEKDYPDPLIQPMEGRD